MKTRSRKDVKQGRTKVIKNRTYRCEPTYWETASFAAFAVSCSVIIMTLVFTVMLTFT